MISVVIPTLNEAPNIGALVRALGAESEPREIVVADGGSRDGTRALARRLGARVVRAPRGRGAQIRAGARAARGEILLFLHADSVFPAGGLSRIAEVLAASPGVAGGNFRLVFDGDSGFSRRLTVVYNAVRRLGFYYGDSGVFVRRAVYEAIGGIRPIPVMEDYDFIRRLERYGETRRIDDPPLVTSSRKFANRAAPRIVWGWLKIHALFHLGVPPERLARMYYPDQAFPHPRKSLALRRMT